VFENTVALVDFVVLLWCDCKWAARRTSRIKAVLTCAVGTSFGDEDFALSFFVSFYDR
jgi:hypothetical protein